MVKFEHRFQSAYSPKEKVNFECVGPSLTKQSFKDECDINNILSRYERSLGREFLTAYQGHLEGRFGDVSGAVSLQEAYATVNAASELFDAMPANLRARFENDPVKLLDFLGDVGNRDEAVRLGLLNKPVSEDLGSSVPNGVLPKAATP